MPLVPKMVFSRDEPLIPSPKSRGREQPRGPAWHHTCPGLEHPGWDARDGAGQPPLGSAFWEHGGSAGLQHRLSSPNSCGNSRQQRLPVLLRWLAGIEGEKRCPSHRRAPGIPAGASAGLPGGMALPTPAKLPFYCIFHLARGGKAAGGLGD